MLDDDPLLCLEERPVPVLGTYDDLGRVLVERAVDVVIVTFGRVREPSVVDMLRACDRLACEIFFVPRLYELHTVTRDTEVLWGVPLVRLRRAPFRTGAWTVKRIVRRRPRRLALAGARRRSWPLCALLSRWETGSVLFRQNRVGLDGRPFTLLKFRSLRPADGVRVEHALEHRRGRAAAARSAASCAAPRWTSSRSCGTSCAAT